MGATDIHRASLIGGGKKRTKHSHLAVSNRRTRSSRASPIQEATLEMIETEAKNVNDEVAILGLETRDVEGDGNCFFRAVSDQMYGDSSHHPEIRTAVCDYLEAHETDVEFLIDYSRFSNTCKGNKFAHYVQNMRRQCTYAGDVEVMIAGKAYGKEIRIINEKFSMSFECEASDEAITNDQPRRRTRSSGGISGYMKPQTPPAEPGKDIIWLALFGKAEHYKSIRRMGDESNEPAGIDNQLARIPHHLDVSEAAQKAREELKHVSTALHNRAYASLSEPSTPRRGKAARVAAKAKREAATNPASTAATPAIQPTPMVRTLSLTPPAEITTPHWVPRPQEKSPPSSMKLHFALETDESGMLKDRNDMAVEVAHFEKQLAKTYGIHYTVSIENYSNMMQATSDAERRSIFQAIRKEAAGVTAARRRSSASSGEHVEAILAPSASQKLASSSSPESAHHAADSSDVSMDPASPGATSTVPTEANSPSSSVVTSNSKGSRGSHSTRGSSTSDKLHHAKPYDRPPSAAARKFTRAARKDLDLGMEGLQVSSRRSSGASADGDRQSALRQLKETRARQKSRASVRAIAPKI